MSTYSKTHCEESVVYYTQIVDSLEAELYELELADDDTELDARCDLRQEIREAKMELVFWRKQEADAQDDNQPDPEPPAQTEIKIGSKVRLTGDGDYTRGKYKDAEWIVHSRYGADRERSEFGEFAMIGFSHYPGWLGVSVSDLVLIDEPPAPAPLPTASIGEVVA